MRGRLPARFGRLAGLALVLVVLSGAGLVVATSISSDRTEARERQLQTHLAALQDSLVAILTLERADGQAPGRRAIAETLARREARRAINAAQPKAGHHDLEEVTRLYREFERRQAEGDPRLARLFPVLGEVEPVVRLSREVSRLRNASAQAVTAAQHRRLAAILGFTLALMAGVAALLAVVLPVRSLRRRMALRDAEREGKRQAERRYQPIFERHPGPMWLHEQGSGRLLAANDALVAASGWSHDELLKMTVDDLREVRPGADTWRMTRRCGGGLEIEPQTSDITFGGLDAVMVLALDVTESRRTARALQESEAKHRVTVENAHEGIVVYDHQGRIELINARMGEILGIDPTAAVGRHVLEVVHEDDREFLGRQVQKRLAGAAGQSENLLRCPDGDRWLLSSFGPWTDAEGDTRGVIVTCTDITERRRREIQVKRRERRQAALVELGALALRAGSMEEIYDATAVAMNEMIGAEMVLVTVRDGGGFDFKGNCGWPALPTQEACAEYWAAHQHILIAGEPMPFDERSGLRHDALVQNGMRSGLACGVVINGELRAVLGAHSRKVDAFGPEELYFARAVIHIVNSSLARHDAAERIYDLAMRDSLTGLPNRAMFEERLAAWSQSAITSGAIVFIDVDHFKVINDALGHQAGDQLLCALAPRFAQALGDSAVAARFGGDEFVVLLEDVQDEATARALGTTLCQALSRPVEIDSRLHPVSVSVGVAVAGPASLAHRDVISDADAAMYLAKERGRDRVEVFNEHLHERAVTRLHMDRELRAALEAEDQLWCAYQPIVRADGSVASFEALARWRHPERGELSPAEFIPPAEASGLIGALGWYVLQTAVHQAADWVRGPLEQAGGVSVNLSPHQLTDSSLAPRVAALLDDAGLPPELLVLEVTETTLMTDLGVAQRALDALAALGVRIVLDDFGTGFSSLSYLTKLPVTGLKIDRSFVADLGVVASAEAIIRTIVSMSRALRLEVVAEGVETHEQAQALVEIGCDKLQGYLFAAPGPASAVPEMLSSVNWLLPASSAA